MDRYDYPVGHGSRRVQACSAPTPVLLTGLPISQTLPLQGKDPPPTHPTLFLVKATDHPHLNPFLHAATPYTLR
jgi:hypothetical protein